MMTPLNRAGIGRYKIVTIDAVGFGLKRRLTALGIFVGDVIEVTKPAPGPVIFEKRGTRIGIGQGMAIHIMVEKIQKVVDASV
jgi:ferrous iron transport protein A